MKRNTHLTLSAVPTPWELARLPKDTAVLLALSGGLDSSVLLHLLAAQSKRDGFHLYAAHLHHGIRGEEADRDAEFCSRLAEQYGIPLFVKHTDVPTLAAERGQSIEEAAREERYAFFEELMRKHGIRLLATAHHADDHLETVLFRMARGTGLQGLCGIPAVRSFAGGFLVRPLLEFPKQEIEAYGAREHLPFVQDSTNRESVYARNRIRMEAIPALEHLGGDVQRSAIRMSRALAQDADFLQDAAKAFYEQNDTERGISAKALLEAHPAIRRRALAMLAPCALEAVHIEAIEALLCKGRTGACTPLPDRWIACLQGGMLSILPDIRRDEIPECFPFGEGERTFCDGRLRICATKTENLDDARIVHNLSTHTCIILDETVIKNKKTLVWRIRQAGDVLLTGGRDRRLGELSRRAGLPSALRSVIPVLTDESGILWAPFVGVRDGIKEKKTSEGGYLIECSVSDGTDKRKDE